MPTVPTTSHTRSIPDDVVLVLCGILVTVVDGKMVFSFLFEDCALCGEQEGVMVCDDLVMLLALSVPRWTCMLDCTEWFSKSPKREQIRQNVEIQKLPKFIWF